MSVATSLSPELTDAATAVGLLKADKSLDASWFEDPASRLKTILSNPPQREAAMHLLDALIPPSAGVGAPAGEEWHPLLNGTATRNGNLYLTVRTDGSGTTVLGLAGGLSGPKDSPTTASLHGHVPLVSANGGMVTAVAGTATNPIELDLRLEVDWTTPAQAIGLKAIRVHLALPFASPQPSPVLQVVLEELDLGSGPVAETILDPAHLGPQALNLISGLISQELKQLAGAAGGPEAAALAANLMPLVGLGDGLKPLPLDQLVHGGSAIRQWFADMVATPNSIDLRKWLGHLAGLVGSNAGTAPAAAGTDDDPWVVPLIAISGSSSLKLAVATQKAAGTGTTTLLIKLVIELAPAGAHPEARLDSGVTIASIPLDGTAPASVLPSFSATLRAPGNPADHLIHTAAVSVDSLRAGLQWDGSQLRPLLELINVTASGGSFPRLDLTNADSVVGAAGAAVRTAILDLLGNSPAALNLAAMAGLVHPVNQPAWPHLIDPIQLATHPTQAIAKVHADVLADATNNWSYLLNELRLLAGLSDPVSGTGTETDPWFASLGSAPPISVGIAAWKATGAAPPQRLRLGLVVKASAGSWLALGRIELFGFDIQPAGGTTVQMLGHLHAEVGASPLPSIPPVADIQIGAASLSVSADWVPGSSPSWSAVLKGISVSSEGMSVTLDLSLPTKAPFDIRNPTAGLGISSADLEKLLRMLIAHALLSWGGMPAYTLGALLGIHGNLFGLQSDWPMLVDPLGPGSLFDHPLMALRNWLAAVATGVSSDGSAFAPSLMIWLQALLRGSLPQAPHLGIPAGGIQLSGSGTYDDPWAIPLHSPTTQRLEALTWLEPAGPPQSWLPAIADQILGATDFDTLLPIVEMLEPWISSARGLSFAMDKTQMSSALQALRDYLATSDGVVPVASQLPTDPSWTVGATPLTAAHHLEPRDPSVISQVLDQIEGWAAGGVRAVLLIGPAFADSAAWHDLLIAAEAARPGSTKPGTNFNLRLPNVAPEAVDLRQVTASADFYTADLADDRSGAVKSLSSQIGRVVARILQIRTDAPNLQVTIVAHSTAGLAARQFTVDQPQQVAGLITIGTPLLGSPLTPVTDAAVAGALRFVQRLVPGGVGGHLQDAIDHLVTAVDGVVAVPGAPSRVAQYPVASFAAPASIDTAGVPTLALGSSLADDLFAEVQQALHSLAVNAAAPAAATHLAFGVRAGLGLRAAAPGEVTADATIRADAFRIRLTAGAAEPSHPPQRLVASLSLSRQGSWLVGGPAAFGGVGAPPVDVRVRWLEMGMEVLPPTAGQVRLIRRLSLHDAAFHSPLIDPLTVDDATAAAILGAAFHAVADPSPVAGTPLALLLQALHSLGVTVPDPHGGIGLGIDAWAALKTDPAGYLAPRLPSALASGPGLLGLTGPPTGPWTVALAGLPLEGYVKPALSGSHWQVGLRTSGAGSTGLSMGDGLTATVDASLDLPSLTPRLDAALHAGAVDLEWSTPARQLIVDAPPWLDKVVLYPLPGSATLQGLANELVPRLALSVVFSAVMQYFVGSAWKVGPIDALITSPGKWLSRPSALGGPGGGLDGGKLTKLLNTIADAAGYQHGRGLQLPQGIELSATGSDPLVVSAATMQAIGGVIDVQLGASIDRLLHLTPGGSITLHVPLPGANTWSSVAVTLGIGTGGISLSIVPGSGDPIQLLPHFSGLGTLAAGATALLPTVLDDIVGAFAPRPALLTLTLDLAQALDLWDAAGGFAGHATQIAAIAKPGWMANLGGTSQTAAVNAIAKVINDPTSPLHGAIPGTVNAAGSSLTWSLDLSTVSAGGAAGVGTVGVTVGWAGGSPALSISATGARPPGGAVLADITAGYAAGQLSASVAVEVHVPTGLSFDFGPRVLVSLDSGRFNFKIVPLGAGTDSLLAVQLAPAPALITAPGGLLALVENWLVPVVADLLLAEFKVDLAKKLWSTGPSIHDLLVAAQLVDATDKLKKPLPTLLNMGIGLAVGLATNTSVDITGTLKLSLVNDAGSLGARLAGTEKFDVGEMSVAIDFGPDRPWLSDTDRGLTVYLVKLATTGPPAFKPALKLVGVGAGLAGKDDGKLLDTSVLTLGGVDAFLFLNLPLDSTAGASDFGAAVELVKLGLPLGEAMSGSAGGSNPVAASLLSSSGGSSSAPGDSQPVSPTVDIFVSYRPGPGLVVQIENQTGPLWIPIHRAFGPIYLDQVGVGFVPPPDQAVELLIDGGVKVAGLAVDVYELGVTVPFKSVLAPDHWSLDLKGLGVGFKTTGFAIAGGLIKNPGPPIEYDGMLLVDLSGRSFTVVGAYSRPSDAQGGYTSLFIFVSLPITIGGPPYLFITGLGGGAGYNRRLLVPEQVTDVESFILVEAIDDDSFANDPMRALMQAALAVPPRRGSLWFAAGLRFSSFVVVHSVVVVYVALDRGLEIGVLGLSRMALPEEDEAIASVELALKARFSTAEALLSVQAQLTDNSWLLSKDCQLTGGFAFFIWFRQAQFVLTLGGYHHAFVLPQNFPVVPRLGFHWSVSDAITIKGESYFALTNSCVMAGGRLEVNFQEDGIRVWFTEFADLLVSWDPFHYDVAIGVSIGASFSIQICFLFGCATIGVTVTIGADVHIIGPPLYGEAHVDLAVASVTVPFGTPPTTIQAYIKDFQVFADKYLTAGDPDKTAVGVHLLTGLLPPEPPGAKPAPGTESQPWKLASEFSFLTETRLPTNRFTEFVTNSERTAVGASTIDLAPMAEQSAATGHRVTLEQKSGGGWQAVQADARHFDIQAQIGQVPEATWRFIPPDQQRAAANTIPALTGLKIVGTGIPEGQSAQIPISKLVDTGSSTLPLQQPRPSTTALQDFGADAETLAELMVSAPNAKILRAAVMMLSGNGSFASLRAASGLPASGLPPIAARSISTSRSSAPLVTPLSTGLTMRHLPLGAPPTIARVTDPGPIQLTGPRLRAVLQGRPPMTGDAPPPVGTSVDNVSILGALPRMAPPRLAPLEGARLLRVAGPMASRPTAAPLAGKTLRSSELGWSAGRAHDAAIAQASLDVVADGVLITAGATHIWELPGTAMNVIVRGEGAAVRLVCLGRAGNILKDVELVAGGGGGMPIAPGTTRLAVMALGAVSLPPSRVGAFGAISSALAPPGGVPATGWQAGNLMPQVGPAVFLGRGASLTVPRAAVPSRGRQRTTEAMVRMSEAIADQAGVETHLPLVTEVVAIVLDQQDPSAALDGDLAVYVQGVTLSPPLRVGGGRRLALLYDIVTKDASGDTISIAVGSQTGWRLNGVVGLTGKAREWAARMAGGIPEQLVPDGPLTPEGSAWVWLLATGGHT